MYSHLYTDWKHTRCSDTHITILPEFVMPAGREAEFKAGFSKFYDATKVDFPMCTKFSGFNEFTRFTMSPKGFVILHILQVHLSRTVHTYNALFTLEGRQGRIWLSLLWLWHPRELRLLQGGICGRLWQIFISLKGGYAVSITNIFHIKRGTNNHCYNGVVFMATL